MRDQTGARDTDPFCIRINPPLPVAIRNESDALTPGTVGHIYCCGRLLAAGQPAGVNHLNLESFHTKVVALDQQGKIAHEDAVVLIAGAEEAIGCVQGLEPQATPAA